MMYLGPSGDASLHAHHALQLVIALSGSFELRGAMREAWIPQAMVLVGSDVSHELRAFRCDRIALVYVDADGVDGRRLRTILPPCGMIAFGAAEIAKVRRAARDHGTNPWTMASAREWTETVLEPLLGTAGRPAPMHPAVRRALAYLHASIDQETRLAAVATAAGLSPGRLVHVFREHVGLPIRRYRLWLRLQRATMHALGGRDLTAAAHAAGLADSAHLARTFRRMFGLTPSMLIGNSQFVQAAALDDEPW